MDKSCLVLPANVCALWQRKRQDNRVIWSVVGLQFRRNGRSFRGNNERTQHHFYEIPITGDNPCGAGEFLRSEGTSRISSRNQECGTPLLGSYRGDEGVAQ